MHVLVVDDDPVAQRIMRVFVEKSGYRPSIHSDGAKALEAALAPDAPSIILLDWMLPGMDGPAVCRKIREAKPKLRPYIIMLSAKQGKEEIAEGLDAGADDFVSKPFNVAEMQARLRVARRMVEHQQELLKQIADNEALSQRNSLLGELITERRRHGVHEVPQQPARPRREPTDPVKRGPAEFTDHEVRYALSIALLELRLAIQAVKPTPQLPQMKMSDYCAWGCLMLAQEDIWVDVVVSAAEATAPLLFERALGRPPRDEAEKIGFFAEMGRMVALGFSRMLRTRVADVRQPLMSRAMQLWTSMSAFPLPENLHVFELTIDGQPLRLLICHSPCAKLRIAPDAVRTLDILATPFPPPEISAVPMLNEGVVLNVRYIEKMLAHDVAVQQGDSACVYRPSKIARFFNPS